MTPDDHQQITQFLTTFDAIGLGEGDIVAGVNTLAAMFCTLTNVARPGSGLLSSDRKKVTHVGSSILISGALSSSLVTDDVLTPLRLKQNNLTSQLERVRGLKEKQDQAGPPRTQSFLERPAKNQSQGALMGLLGDNHGSTASTAQKWATVTQHPPNPDYESLTSNTKIVVSASTTAELEKQLLDTHLGRPLALLGLNRSAGTERMSNLCSALIDGRLPDGEGGKTVRGNIIITDPNDMLSTLAKNANENTTWLGRMLWLVDGAAGPEVPQYESTASPLGNIHSKFQSVLSAGLGKRLDHTSPHPALHELDMTPHQIRWVQFLQSMEGNLPGISGTARNLLATLVFGALELISTPIKQVDTHKQLHGIEAFAKFLIHRMANARNVMTYSAREARNDELKASILHKLEAGPHTVRDLTRRFSRLTTEPCRELLADLEKQGKVQNHDGEWSLTNSTTQPLTLDI